uniref:Bradykinin-potentiating peptide 25.12 n=1 Tax=Lychas mucronatus TaxID=172552 RepID=NDBS_LYCMC|nr:RecName: Full=Bradykinin-potentiating peptide 25.12; Short=BPP-25.12; Flags: Precursor [Lychas mucronatus]
MNKRVLLVIFFVTLLIADEVNSFSFFRKAKGFLKKIWKSKIARRLREKGMKALKNYANDVINGPAEAPAAAAAPEEPPVEQRRRRR